MRFCLIVPTSLILEPGEATWSKLLPSHFSGELLLYAFNTKMAGTILQDEFKYTSIRGNVTLVSTPVT